MINKIDFNAKNLTSNAGLFLLLENAKENAIFEMIENDLVFESDSVNKIKMNHKEGRRLEAEWIVNSIVKELAILKVDAWILGCTELPLIFSKQYGKIALIDSSWILARKAILISGAQLSETDHFYKRMAMGTSS